METKVCNTCNEEKPISNFHKFRNGVRNYCSKCSTELIKKYREENPEWYEKTKETHRIKKRGRTKEERHEDNLKKRAWRRNVSIDIILEEERISELAESQNKKYCYDCKTILNKEYFGKHKQAKDGLNTICKDCRKIMVNKYYHNNSVVMNLKKTEYNIKNRGRVRIRQKNYVSRRRNSDEMFKLCLNLRARLKGYLRIKNLSRKINKKTLDMIGCSPAELKQHIESNFVKGMSWDNYGITGWHIDHIIPLSSAKTKEDAILLNHYTNLQPLWAIDNIKKGKKIL
jgi:hypothetical protein